MRDTGTSSTQFSPAQGQKTLYSKTQAIWDHSRPGERNSPTRQQLFSPTPIWGPRARKLISTAPPRQPPAPPHLCRTQPSHQGLCPGPGLPSRIPDPRGLPQPFVVLAVGLHIHVYTAGLAAAELPASCSREGRSHTHGPGGADPHPVSGSHSPKGSLTSLLPAGMRQNKGSDSKNRGMDTRRQGGSRAGCGARKMGQALLEH